LYPPYVAKENPQVFFSAYFRPRFDKTHRVTDVVAAFKRFLEPEEQAHAGDAQGSRNHTLKAGELLREMRDDILRVAARHGARNIRIFGSAARGEMGPDSDIDFLVDLEPGRTLLDLSGLWADLSELLGRRIDVVTEHGIYWLLRRRILKEARSL
jgi:predicted nucleotidyltransferase